MKRIESSDSRFFVSLCAYLDFYFSCRWAAVRAVFTFLIVSVVTHASVAWFQAPSQSPRNQRALKVIKEKLFCFYNRTENVWNFLMTCVMSCFCTSRGLEVSSDLRLFRLRKLLPLEMLAVECLRRSRYSGAECWCRFVPLLPVDGVLYALFPSPSAWLLFDCRSWLLPLQRCSWPNCKTSCRAWSGMTAS